MTQDPFAAFRDAAMARGVVRELQSLQSDLPVKLMHVCGTHENAIAKYGLRDLMPSWLTVIAGPGCPVCICPASDIQMAVDLALEHDVCVTTFGDMFRVPARMSLADAKSEGGEIRIVFSVMDAIELARSRPDRQVVFFAVGFETTAVTTAAAALTDTPENFSLLVSHRLVPSALEALALTTELGVKGLLLPGHVVTVMGTEDYEVFPSKYSLPVTVGGFEPADVLLAVLSLAKMAVSGKARLDNVYTRAVKKLGNEKATQALWKVFEICDAHWRGIGLVPGTGLALRKEYSALDAIARFGLTPDLSLEELQPGCLCGEVMLGKSEPGECRLFGKACTPENPYGPCMVSMEGTCRNSFKYSIGLR
jgi:hydrogenase expression/formation protein HypD